MRIKMIKTAVMLTAAATIGFIAGLSVLIANIILSL